MGRSGNHTIITALSALEALSAWPAAERGLTLQGLPAGGGCPGLPIVEAFCIVDEVSRPFDLRVSLVTTSDTCARALLGRPVTLTSRLPDGQSSCRTGLVLEARPQEAGEGLARHTLRIRPWPALLAGPVRRRAWRDITVPSLVESLIAEQPEVASRAAWRWDFDVAAWLGEGFFGRRGGRRPCCRQDGESDLAFVQRLLTEEGVDWRVEEDSASPTGHRVVFYVRAQGQPLESGPFPWAWRAGRRAPEAPMLKEVAAASSLVRTAAPARLVAQVQAVEIQPLPARLADRLERALGLGPRDVAQDLAEGCDLSALTDLAALVPEALRQGRAARCQSQQSRPSSSPVVPALARPVLAARTSCVSLFP